MGAEGGRAPSGTAFWATAIACEGVPVWWHVGAPLVVRLSCRAASQHCHSRRVMHAVRSGDIVLALASVGRSSAHKSKPEGHVFNVCLNE